MKKHLLLAVCITMQISYLLAQSVSEAVRFTYPPAQKAGFDTTIFGIRLSDPYFWMGRPEHEAEMQQFSAEQGRFAEKILDSLPGAASLMGDLDGVFEAMQHDIWSMQTMQGFIYYYRDIPGEGPTLCRRKSIDTAEEKILGRVRISGRRYSVRKSCFAYNKPLLALMLTEGGEANPHIRIYDMDRKFFLPDSIGAVMFNDSRGVSMAWDNRDEKLFYTQSPPTMKLAEKYFYGPFVWGLIVGACTLQSNGIAMPASWHFAGNLTTAAFAAKANPQSIWLMQETAATAAARESL